MGKRLLPEEIENSNDLFKVPIIPEIPGITSVRPVVEASSSSDGGKSWDQQLADWNEAVLRENAARGIIAEVK
jgi:hypothetical protein